MSSLSALPILATQAKIKKEGDISSVFTSLSNSTAKPLPERFATLKQNLLQGQEEALVESWERLLEKLKVANRAIIEQGSSVIPEASYADL